MKHLRGALEDGEQYFQGVTPTPEMAMERRAHMKLLYVLDEQGRPAAESDADVWAKWMATADRTVAKSQVGEALVSTVFLGVDHLDLPRKSGGPF